MGYETQRMDLSLKTHFKKWDMKLKEGIWVSKNTLKNGIWNSKDGFEPQRTFSKIKYETQRVDLSLNTHFKKLDIKLRIFWNVIWDWNPLFEVHILFFEMLFATEIHSLRLISHVLKCVLRLKSCIWVSYPIFKMSCETHNPTLSFISDV